ncbi:MAG: hypothetical protein ACTHOD_07160 [Motilibacteraceae bacterium]
MPRRRPLDSYALDVLSAQRGGVVRAAELDRLGVPRSTASWRARPGGPWQRLEPGVLLLASGAPSAAHRRSAALLYCGGGSMFTGATACRLYGLRTAPAGGPLHVLVPHRRRRASTASTLVERSRRLPDHRSVDRLPCAPPARALIDAVRKMRDLRAVRALIAEGVQRRLVTAHELAAELRACTTRGTALPRKVLKEIVAGVRSVSEAEARDLLRRHGLPEPVWNEDVYARDGSWLGQPDACWLELGVVLEIDSMEWHLSPADYRKTQARQRRFAKAGVTVVPAAPADIRENGGRVVEEVRGALAAARSRPSLGLRLSPRPATA